MKRTLTLKSEPLAALADSELADVVGGQITGPSCLALGCINTSPARCYWATFDNC